MSAKLRRAVRALRDFLRGFVGALPAARETSGVERELAHRCARRGNCC
jgi:hypothetical protein